MCFSQPKMPEPAPPPAPPPPPLPTAERAVTQRATQPTKRRRGTQQLTRSVRRPTLSMGGGTAGTGVQLSQ
jgi:hypothetical protein